MKKKTIIKLKLKSEKKTYYLEKEIEGELLYCPKGTLISFAKDWACEEVKFYSISITKNEIIAYIDVDSYIVEEELKEYKKTLMKEGFKCI
ncbi:MAG TPA: hypothetical protein ENG63_09680 [Candidatus Desulfofervidus auxilii]|uniref:Uncharacterized protein n=1 Tax=Desulfofervidus auxilii TaxID=1621989 RepID=A0A7C0Y8G3_DESA2|nr:hypothetical protein [Candidatus Desulfofervidus auxilii]